MAKRQKPRSKAPPASTAIEAERLSTKQLRLGAASIGLLALLTYSLTLWPSVPGGDSGELITIAYTLGIAHPPGYPLFTLLAKLFTYIPHGSVAWRVNFFSAFCDAASAAFLFLAVARWSRSLAAGIAAAGLFAFAPLIWTWATQAEVFALNNFFVTALLALAALYEEKRSRRILLFTAFVFGLGLTNHQTLLFVGTPIGIWMLALSGRELLNARGVIQVTLCFAAGLLVYLYLPLAALHHPIEQWGDPTTIDGFLTHVLRKEYGTLQLGASNEAPQFFNALRLYFSWLPGELLYAGVLLAGFGLYKAARNKSDAGYGRLTLVIWAFYMLVFNYLANLPIHERLNFGIFTRFWQQADIFVFAWAGYGFAELHLYLTTKIKSLASPAPMMRRLPAVLAGALVLVQLGIHYKEQDQHRNRVFQQFGDSLLAQLPRGALLFTRGDLYTNGTSYLQQCEGMRPDVIVMDRELLKTQWRRKQVEHDFPSVVLPQGVYRFKKEDGAYNLGEVIRANIDRHPIFICNMDPEEDQTWQGELASWPFGMINEVVRNDGSFDVHQYVEATADVLGGFDIRVLPPREELFAWDFYIWNEYWEADHRKGRRLMTYAIDHGNDPLLLRDSVNLMSNLVKRHPAPPPLLFKNLGYAYSRLALTDPTATPLEGKAWRTYLQMAEDEADPDPDLPVIRKAVEAIPVTK